MLDLNFVFDFVHEHFGDITISKGGTHFNFRCPYCGDSLKNLKKKRFHLQYKSDDEIVFNCFNCPARGNIFDLYAHVNGITPEEAYKKLTKFNADELAKYLKNKGKSKIAKDIDYTSYQDFGEFLRTKCLSIHSPASGFVDKKLIEILKGFIEERKISHDKIYICHSGRFEKRIIIPIFYNKICVFYQARRINETQDPKYLNPSVEKENIILNKDKFDRNKFIIVTEGILDSDAAGTQGTTCLGATINDLFFEELLKYTDKGIILALDNDKTGLEQMEKIMKNSIYNKKLLYFFLKEYKDLNDFHIKNDDIDVYKYVVDNRLSYLGAYTKF